MYGHHMAVGNYNGVLVTYKFDRQRNSWIRNGKHSVPGMGSDVSMQKNLLVVTVSDWQRHPAVCGIVYKLTATTATTNDNNNNNNRSVTTMSNKNNNDVNIVWKEFARLTIRGDPLKAFKGISSVSIENGIVFTGSGQDGKVFIHKLSN